MEGVNEAGIGKLEVVLGGVCDREGSLMVVECEAVNKVGSGERVGGVGWGIVLSKISDLRSVENVLLASSAAIPH